MDSKKILFFLFLVSAQISSSFAAKRGPMPWTVFATHAPRVKPVEIPTIKSACARAPEISSFKVSRSFYQYGDAQLDFKISWCDPRAASDALRLRVLAIAGKQRGRTLVTVLKSATQSNFVRTLATLCRPQRIYLEACARRPGAARPLCATSAVRTLFKLTVAEPVLLQRPPPVLRLAPGDVAGIVYRIDPGKKSFGHGTAPYRLQVVAVARSGRWLGASPWATGGGSKNGASHVSAILPLRRRWGHGGGGVRPWEYNGAEVFLRFAYRSCPSNVATLRLREKTTVHVRSGTLPLVRQDKKVPTVPKLVYPPTVFGKPVSLLARAENPGMGRRKGWQPTKLTYQWFFRDFDFGFSPSFAKPLEGENGAMLRLPRAECQTRSCGRHGCSDLKQWSVRVCNTLGCTLSNSVEPSILPPPLKPGQKWDGYNCRISS